MKSIISAGLLLLTTITLLTSSCKKDEDGDAMVLPTIVFKTTSGYTSANATVAKGATVLTGIAASKSEAADVLTLFSITKSLNNGSPSTVFSETLTGTAGDAYTRDYVIATGTATGTEKYTYTIANRDGLTNSVSLTLTVQ